MKLTIQLDTLDFIEIRKFLLSNKRHTLSGDFADYVSLKIQKKGVKCWLKNKYNYVSIKKKDRVNSQKIWSGKFECVSVDCSNIFFLRINSSANFNESVNGQLVIVFDDLSYHEENIYRIRCFGDKREEQKTSLRLHGITNTLSSNLIENRMKFNKGNYSII